MTKKTSEINWSEISSPISINLFEKLLHQSVHTPIQYLGFNETLWSHCRSFALKLNQQGFIDPISILYTAFKHYCPFHVTFNAFSRWFLLNELNKNDFPINSLRYPIFQSLDDLNKLSSQSPPTTKDIHINNSLDNIDQIWLLIPISLLLPINNYTLTPDIIILDNDATRLSLTHKKSTAERLHCLLAITPSGKYSNQLIVCKPGRNFKVNFSSNSFTKIIDTTNGNISYEHIKQWLEDFTALPFVSKNSALLVDPRTTLFMSDIENFNIRIITTDLNIYITNIILPFFNLFNKQWSEANKIDKMKLKSVGNIERAIHTIWYTLRTVKQNDQLYQLYHQTILWKNFDQEYYQYLQTLTNKNLFPKKKKKKLLIKTNKIKTCLSSTTTTAPMMNDPPPDSTPEQILSDILNRQISISRASKYLGGMNLDYLKYCLSYKMNSSLMNGSALIQLNGFMQSKSTVDWLRSLGTLYFWPCAKQLFLREVYHLTGIITRKRSMNLCGNNNMGSIRSCDQQSPGIFWRAFEDIHHIQLDNELINDGKQWNEDFQQYLHENKLNHEKTQLWTFDTFEFPLTKNSTILQLPEWNELRPMNLTPKVTVLYAFSNDGQSTEPHFIFPVSLRDNTTSNEENSYNELGHLTPQIFLLWIEKYFPQKGEVPMVLIFCSRLPVLSPQVISSLEQYKIYPFGYPSTRILPFRYLFERRVRNNRSTNLMSELWKKKLLDQQRTHVLKGLNCTVKNIKYYFEQIWPILITEKRDDDDENKTFKDKCHQAFQQAHIELENFDDNHSINTDTLVNQLNNMISIINQLKEQVNSTQILKIKSNDSIENFQLKTNILSEQLSNNDKRTINENDQPRSSKRHRSSSSLQTNQWTPPSKQLILHIQSQSSSIFQFILLLIHYILTSSDTHLTDEQYQWLHTTVNQYHSNYNIDKLNVIIETACIVAKRDLVR